MLHTSAHPDGLPLYVGYEGAELLSPDGRHRTQWRFDSEAPHGDSLNLLWLDDVQLPGRYCSRFSAQRVAFFYTGTDIPHAHAHVVPMVETSDVTSRRYIREESMTFQQCRAHPTPNWPASRDHCRRAASDALT